MREKFAVLLEKSEKKNGGSQRPWMGKTVQRDSFQDNAIRPQMCEISRLQEKGPETTSPSKGGKNMRSIRWGTSSAR